MSHPFSTKGTIGRFGFLCYLLLYILSPILGLFTWLVLELLDSPLLGSPAAGYLWGERSAAFVRDHLSWITDGWGPGILVFGFYLLGYHLVDCAYIKRARSIGVEIESVWVVPLYFFGFQPGATFRELLLTRSRHSCQKSRDGHKDGQS